MIKVPKHIEDAVKRQKRKQKTEAEKRKEAEKQIEQLQKIAVDLKNNGIISQYPEGDWGLHIRIRGFQNVIHVVTNYLRIATILKDMGFGAREKEEEKSRIILPS